MPFVANARDCFSRATLGSINRAVRREMTRHLGEVLVTKTCHCKTASLGSFLNYISRDYVEASHPPGGKGIIRSKHILLCTK